MHVGVVLPSMALHIMCTIQQDTDCFTTTWQLQKLMPVHDCCHVCVGVKKWGQATGAGHMWEQSQAC